jgi:pimeloyl-ACP methyl ester carboxylesterase
MSNRLAFRRRLRGVALVFGTLLAGLASQALAQTGFTSDRITVHVRGSGPDVVLVPGLASSHAVWARTADDLDDAHRVHLVQVNGFAGQPSGANATGPVFEALTTEVARYITSSGLKRPAVIGHSMGGALALALAAKQPHAVSRLMLVDSLPFFSLLMNPAATPDNVRPQAEAMRAALIAMTPEQYSATAPSGLLRLVKDPGARVRSGAEAAASDRAVVGQAMLDIMTTDLRPMLPNLKVPVTVLYASDPLMGPAAAVEALWSRAYAGARGVKLIRVDDSLHFIMDDQPVQFEAEVRAFLTAP